MLTYGSEHSQGFHLIGSLQGTELLPCISASDIESHSEASTSPDMKFTQEDKHCVAKFQFTPLFTPLPPFTIFVFSPSKIRHCYLLLGRHKGWSVNLQKKKKNNSEEILQKILNIVVEFIHCNIKIYNKSKRTEKEEMYCLCIICRSEKYYLMQKKNVFVLLEIFIFDSWEIKQA